MPEVYDACVGTIAEVGRSEYHRGGFELAPGTRQPNPSFTSRPVQQRESHRPIVFARFSNEAKSELSKTDGHER